MYPTWNVGTHRDQCTIRVLHEVNRPTRKNYGRVDVYHSVGCTHATPTCTLVCGHSKVCFTASKYIFKYVSIRTPEISESLGGFCKIPGKNLGDPKVSFRQIDQQVRCTVYASLYLSRWTPYTDKMARPNRPRTFFHVDQIDQVVGCTLHGTMVYTGISVQYENE